jgi:hypothetical protein
MVALMAALMVEMMVEKMVDMMVAQRADHLVLLVYLLVGKRVVLMVG